MVSVVQAPWVVEGVRISCEMNGDHAAMGVPRTATLCIHSAGVHDGMVPHSPQHVL